MPPRPLLEEALRHVALARSAALDVLQDTHRAEDVAQEALLAVPGDVDRSGGPRALGAWLRATARKLALAARRSERRRLARETDAARPEATPSAVDVLERVALQRRIAAAVEALPSPDREIVALRYWDDAPPREIARRLGLSANVVSTRLSRAKARLAAALEDDDPRPCAPVSAALALWHPRPTGLVSLTSLAPLGAIAMKKLAIAAAVIAALLLGRGALRSPESLRPGRDAPLVAERRAELVQSDAPRAVAAPIRSEREPGVVQLEHAVELPGNAPVETESPTAATVLVRVTDASSGAPAPDVGLKIVPWSATRIWFHRRSTTTDAAGWARFDRVPPGRCCVYVRRLTAANVFGAEEVEVAAGGTYELDVQVVAGATIRGTVRDDAGRPVAGAEVWLGAGSGPPTSDGDIVTRTDGAGRYTLRHAANHQGVAARAAGFAPSRAVVPLFVAGGSPDDERTEYDVDLVLGSLGGTLDGLVVGEDGVPEPDALVIVSVSPGPTRTEDGRPLWGPPDLELRTDSSGRFRTDVMGAGTLLVRARGADTAIAAASVSVPVGGVGTVRLELGRSATVFGRVTTDRGLPAPDSLVELDGDDRVFLWSSATTTADGQFVLPGLPPGRVTLEVRSRALDSSVRATFDLGPGEAREWLPVLTTPFELVGQVVDGGGAALAGWLVRRIAEGAPAGDPMAQGQGITDTNGGFRLQGCLDVPHTLAVRPPGQVFATPVAEAHGITPSATPTTIVVPEEFIPRFELRGRCVDAAGAPLAVKVTIRATDPTVIVSDGTTDAAGVFVFRHLAAATYRLTVEAPNRATETTAGPVALNTEVPAVDVGDLVVE